MMPWEREIYITLLTQYIQEENEKAKTEEIATWREED
jgi:hypothetical protein